MAVKSRIDAWTLLRVLVVPCLFLCAIFKRPIFQWIACAALFVWVCFVISKLFRSHRKHCKKMPDGAEAIDTLPILRCAHQLGVCEQGPHRRRMERGLLSCTGCVVLGKAHRLGSGIFRVVKGRRLLETEAPSFKQFGLSHNHTSLKNKLGLSLIHI